MKVVKVVNDFSGRIQVGIACAGPQICEVGFHLSSVLSQVHKAIRVAYHLQ